MFTLCVILLIVGILALALELLMPGYDGFIGAVVGVLALITSAVLAVFWLDNGWIFVGTNISVLMICGYFAYLLFRKKQHSGNLINTDTLAEDPLRVDFQSLVGKEGKAVTTLRPSGEADFNGLRVQVTTNGEMVQRGTRLRVLDATPTKVIVGVVNGN